MLLNGMRDATDERMRMRPSERYTFAASSAVIDGVQKHSPCSLITTTGVQRKPGVQVRLVAESPKASRHSHLNPRFKVVFASIAMAEDAIISSGAGRVTRRAGLHAPNLHVPGNPRSCAGFLLPADAELQS